jgi:K+ transporter
VDLDRAVYLGSRDDVIAGRARRVLPFWRRWRFAFLYRNAARTVDRFNLPPEHFIEVGRQIEV